jgi:hypothetical protein
MTQTNINNRSYFFTINHISKETSGKLIYGIDINSIHYFLSKTSGLNDCEQLDNNTPLNAEMHSEICTVLTTLEGRHPKRPSLEQFNRDIFSLLIRLRNVSRVNLFGLM